MIISLSQFYRGKYIKNSISLILVFLCYGLLLFAMSFMWIVIRKFAVFYNIKENLILNILFKVINANKSQKSSDIIFFIKRHIRIQCFYHKLPIYKK